jgi:FkbM family methyltransferase
MLGLIFKVLYFLGFNRVAPGNNYSWSIPYLKDMKNCGLLLEIGSRDCLDAISLAKKFECQVIAFEPSPPNYIVCQANLSKESALNIILDSRCLTDASGPVQFGVIDENLYDNPGASSIFEIDFSNRQNSDPDKGRSSIQKFTQVEGVRFDETDYASPHTVFMDTQGAELLVLKGFGNRLNEVQNLVLETSMVTTYLGGSSFWEIRNYLKEFGLNYIISDHYGKQEPKSSMLENWQGEFNVVFGR